MAQPTYAISANSLTAETFRQAPASLISGAGVVGSGDLAVTQNGTPNMSVNVAAGQVWTPGTLSSSTGFPTNLNAQTAYGLPASFNQQSSYFQWYNATTNLVVPAADPTNPRIDIAVISIQDAAYSGSNNQGIPQYITGTPNPSPVAPNAPASSVVLAQVSVAANQTSVVTANITDKRPFRQLQVGPHLVTAPGAAVLQTVSLASSFQNTNTYNVLVFGTAVVSTAGSVGLAVGSGPTSSPGLITVLFDATSQAIGTIIPFVVYVPASYWGQVNQNAGTAVLGGVNAVAFPV